MQDLENQLNMKELQKMAIKIDFLPKNLRIGAMFPMSGVNWIHIGKGKCLVVMFEDELIPEFKC